MKHIAVCNTGGNGYWSTKEFPVYITKLEIAYLDESNLLDSTFGELRVYFDTKYWETDNNGLIYTDAEWIKNFRLLLVDNGFSFAAVYEVEYSEQGMQGPDYVSLDVKHHFLQECDPFINFVTSKLKSIPIRVLPTRS